MWAIICNRRTVILSSDILRNEIHRTRTIQRNSGNNIFQVMRLQFLHEPFHSGTLKLEHSICLTCSDIIQHLLIIVIYLIDIQFRLLSSCKQHCILYHSQCTKAQEVHFQKSKLLKCCHNKLRCDCSVCCPRKRYILINRLLTDNNTGGMHRTMSR